MRLTVPHRPLGAVPTLSAIRERPELAATLPLHSALQLLAQVTTDLATIQTVRDALLVRVATACSAAVPGPAAPGESPDDSMLTAHEASLILRRKVRWLYRNKDKLPFVVKVSSRTILCSERGLRQWLKKRPN